MKYEQVKELISIFEEDRDLTELELSFDNVELRLNRGDTRRYASMMPGFGMPPAPPQQTAGPGVKLVTAEESAPEPQGEPQAAPAKAPAQAGNVMKSPIVGTFYQSASPDKPPFVKVGDHVNKGDVLCIIEAMKFMNEIQSEYTGTIKEILVENETLVEYGQELFIIE